MKNLALFTLGFVDEIDFSVLTNPTVMKVNRIYPTSRDFVLSNYYWRFVMKRAVLTNPIQMTDTFTAAVSDTLTMTSTNRYLWDGLEVTLTTTDTLPAGLALATTYYVISASTNTCELSLTAGGSAVDVTDTGTGTHTVTFQALYVSPYKYLFNTPSDTLVLRHAYVDADNCQPINDYEYTNDGFFTNTIRNQDLSVRFWYSADLDEELFPVYFVDYFKYKLALDLCFNLTGDRQLQSDLFGISEKMLLTSKNIDAKQVKSRTIKSSPFTNIRGSGSYSNGISNT